MFIIIVRYTYCGGATHLKAFTTIPTRLNSFKRIVVIQKIPEGLRPGTMSEYKYVAEVNV